MPQMNPMSWTLLFTYFIYLFYLFNLITYFMFTNKNNFTVSSFNKINKTLTWLW
uniref:ATP synthase F0 subunit 8 n=1 Tax=Wormaldia unispina TaxID=2683984 RepID=UPI0022DCE2C7|nr:ATP synthase F0 subunit 8 [Wormaldia unispina]UZZ44458.1 ATP synthase F0 subunit 8 [Wormaldia unispina]